MGDLLCVVCYAGLGDFVYFDLCILKVYIYVCMYIMMGWSLVIYYLMHACMHVACLACFARDYYCYNCCAGL